MTFSKYLNEKICFPYPRGGCRILPKKHYYEEEKHYILLYTKKNILEGIICMLEIKRIENTDLKDLSLLFKELSGKKSIWENMIKNFELINKNGDYILLGAKYYGELVGSLMGILCLDLVGECKPFMVIENVIVLSKARGKGIGKKLMIEIERIGKKKNCHYIIFVSGANRKDAHKFYESLGYKLDKVQGFKKILG